MFRAARRQNVGSKTLRRGMKQPQQHKTLDYMSGKEINACVSVSLWRITFVSPRGVQKSRGAPKSDWMYDVPDKDEGEEGGRERQRAPDL